MSVGILFCIYGINSMLSGVFREAHDLSHASLKSFASNDNSSCHFKDNSLYRCGQSCFKCLLKLLQMAGKIWVCYKPTNRHDRWRSFLHRFLIVYKALELILWHTKFIYIFSEALYLVSALIVKALFNFHNGCKHNHGRTVIISCVSFNFYCFSG